MQLSLNTIIISCTTYIHIGEHIDYALFGVFPAAIEQDVLVAFARRQYEANEEEQDDPGRVTVENQDRKYTRQTFAPVIDASEDWQLDFDKEQLRWESYVKAGYYVRTGHAISL